MKISGILPSAKELSEFMGVLSHSELGRKEHILGPIQTEILGREAFKVTIIFRSHCDFLVESSLKNGLLSTWGNLFSEVEHKKIEAWQDKVA
jgi:hypothetical protein